VRFGPVTLDVVARRISCDGVPLHLTPKAFDLLALLVREAPRVVPKAELHRALWPETFVSDAALATLVKEVRRELRDRGQPASLIRTVHGIGHALAASVEAVPAAGPADARHWIEANGRRIRLVAGENLIGRDPAARVWLDVASVSRRHASIIIDAEGALLEDLGSKNGTTVGTETVSGRVRLRDGDIVRVGSMRLVYRASTSGMPTETHAGPP
jgi:DNA-binding winged helix-turn-helix (wHTH) protein